MLKLTNPNPLGREVGDCTVRALSLALGQSWEKTYVEMCFQGFLMGNMPSGNEVWGAVLERKGFRRHRLPNLCPECYTVEEFAKDFPRGTYVLGIDGHAVCVKDGNWLDTWQSEKQVPIYYWERMT